MSFLTAVLNAAGGYGQGKQQKFQNQQSQQQLTDEEDQQRQAEADRQRELGYEQQRADEEAQTFKDTEEDRMRNRGIDPATGKPFVMPGNLMRVVPGKVGTTYQPTSQDQYNHALRLYNYYASTGQTDKANGALQQMSDLKAQMASEATFARDLYNRAHPTAHEIWEEEHPQRPMTAMELWEIAHGGPPGHEASARATQAAKEATQYYNDFKQEWGNLTGVPKGPMGLPPLDPVTHKPMTARLTAQQQQAAQSVFSTLDESNTPQKTLAEMKKSLKGKLPPDVEAVVDKYAKYRQAKVDSEAATAEGSSGGSDAAPPFQGVKFTDPTSQADLPRTSARMQGAFSVVAQYQPTVTSVMHGHHEGATSGPNEDPHYAGRAVDVGAFGGVTVGMNQQTWDAITGAITSGQFSKIGTIPALAENKDLQAFAQEHGVQLFVDVGSGPHVHFEVGQ